MKAKDGGSELSSGVKAARKHLPAKAPRKSPVKGPAGAAKKDKKIPTQPKTKANHPKTADMVYAAIENLKERKGSSLQAIKKYMTTTYDVKIDKLAPYIRKYLNGAVESGILIRTKGIGAAGSFKLNKTTRGKPKELAKYKPEVSQKVKADVPKKKPEAKPNSSARKQEKIAKSKKSNEEPSKTKGTASQKLKVTKSKKPSRADPAKKTSSKETAKPKAKAKKASKSK